MDRTGEIFALLTAFCWSITAVSFEISGKRIGAISVNIIRLVFAFILFAIFSQITSGFFIPLNISFFTWKWLLISGLIGFVLGDLFLFQGFINIGARISMLLMSLVPVFSAIIDYFLLNETLNFQKIIGMMITVTGICIVVFSHGSSNKLSKENHRTINGIIFAALGALGQAAGLVLSRYAIGSTNPFAATQIRTIAGIAGFTVIIIFTSKTREVISGFLNKSALKFVTIGTIFGPFLGVTFSLAAVQHTGAGVASTIMSIVPVLLIIPSIFIFKEKVRIPEILGALLSVAGVGILFI